MSRLATGLDRLLVLLVGLVLIVVGAGAILWQLATFSQAPKTLTAPGLVHATTQSWWPWAVGIGGAVLILLSLRWLGAHVPGRKVHDVKLAGSDATGKLTVDLSALAAAAAEALAEAPGVRSATGKAVTDRGRRTLELIATMEPTADLAAVTVAVDRVGADLNQALAEPAIATRVHLHSARRARSGPRVS